MGLTSSRVELRRRFKVLTSDAVVLAWVKDHLGLDHNMVSNIQINLAAHGPVTATVTLYLDRDQLDELGRLLDSGDWKIPADA